MLKKKIVAGVLVTALMMSMGTGAAFADSEEAVTTGGENIQVSEDVEAAAEDEEQPVLISAPVAPDFLPGGIDAGGEFLNLEAIGVNLYVKNDNMMIPLRAVAEKLGYKVTWDNELKAAKIDNGTYGMTFHIGKDTYARYSTVEGSMGFTTPETLGTAPELVNSVTMIPAKALELLDLNVETDKSTMGVRITEKKETSDPSVQIPNPIVEYKTLEEAMKAFGQDVKIPVSLRTAEADFYCVIDKTLLEVQYKDGSYFRVEAQDPKAEGVQDISGDYNLYKYEKALAVDSVKEGVTLKGVTKSNKEDAVKLVYWMDGTNAYSISYGEESGLDSMEKDIASIY